MKNAYKSTPQNNAKNANELIYKVSIEPAPALDFWPLESRHFVSYLIQLNQFLSLWSFADCGFRVRISSRVRASVSFICCIFFLSHVG